MLYWSDAKKRTVQAVKISGKNRQVLLKRPGQPFAVKVSSPGGQTFTLVNIVLTGLQNGSC